MQALPQMMPEVMQTGNDEVGGGEGWPSCCTQDGRCGLGGSDLKAWSEKAHDGKV